jgi:hypothetical protein
VARLIYLFIVLFPALLHAGLIQDKVYQSKKKVFTLAQVCDFYQRENLPFIESIGKHRVDCMGKTFSVLDFCHQKLKGESFARGLIQGKEVHCFSAQAVVLKYHCTGKSTLCERPQKSCGELQKLLARELVPYRMFQQQENQKNILNCYFTAKDSLLQKDELSL